MVRIMWIILMTIVTTIWFLTIMRVTTLILTEFLTRPTPVSIPMVTVWTMVTRVPM